MQNFTALLLNLDRDTERLSHMQKQLAQAGIDYSRQPGILGDQVPDDLRGYFYDAAGVPKTTMKRGEIGCYASHLRAMKRIASGEAGYMALVMEDDLEIAPDILTLITQAQKFMPLGWDILRLSSPPRRAYVPLAELDGGRKLIHYSKIPNSAGAYLITMVGAQKFLAKGVRGLTFDDDLRRPWFHGLDTYGITPPAMRAGMLKSTIDAVEAGRFDKPMSSRMERILRGDHFHAWRRANYNRHNLGTKNWLTCGAINIAAMVLKPVVGKGFIDRAARFFPTRQTKQR